MLPINSLDKFLFICLYNFANRSNTYIFTIFLYIAVGVYFGINDGQIAIMFVLSFMMLVLLALSINDKFRQEFKRYKQYQKIKRIRSYKGR
ncbi:hypothetical protein [Arcobacter porcinus]|uniref:Putative membrane protein n=1 Tax=Arcobacter porcinus TaxID=1935204 RepID=A0A5C2HC92_9BACT|nr:hypothetical protein [Arcobacter porcinus]OCL89422.1 hypothetical protein AAX27_01953 [Aliarcobacter thereius]QEP40439.1 putative membrane protein [Arcobacter porcinus]